MTVQAQAKLRAALPSDAEAISRLISEALRHTNASDYTTSVIDWMAATYSAPRVGQMIRAREMFVAEADAEIVGTIGYASGTVRSLFVAPVHQRHGIGRQLITAVEGLACGADIRSLTVAASLTAIGFYRRCGFEMLRPVEPSGIAMMLMHKWLDDTDDTAPEADWWNR
ncbi:MAG TPA: GNAT family N-acetyltransferase [Dongiaceae bacterium]|nr:GNAT family N-acetyltransferase [Dongiaceae bacterium]